jgi:hypothetical protein
MTRSPISGHGTDPLDKLLRDEAKTCKGCPHAEVVWGEAWCPKKGRAADRRCKEHPDEVEKLQLRGRRR